MDLVLAFRDLKSMYFGTNIFAPVATVLMIFVKKLNAYIVLYVRVINAALTNKLLKKALRNQPERDFFFNGNFLFN